MQKSGLQEKRTHCWSWKRLSARPHKNFCLQDRLPEGKHGITCLRFYLLGFQAWAVCLPETFSTCTPWNEVITKYDSTEMSQGPRSTQLSIKENWMEGDRGPDSHLCVKGSLKKASVAFETDLRKGRQEVSQFSQFPGYNLGIFIECGIIPERSCPIMSSKRKNSPPHILQRV